MSLHPVLLDKLNSALALPASAGMTPTHRDAQLPAIVGKVHAVIGMRRAGKTTYLQQLQHERRGAGPAERAVYMSFDDDRLADIDATQLDFLLEEYFRRHPKLRNRDPVLLLLDEIQMIPGWERFVRRVLDTERVEIVVSGSSARLLSREVHTSLRGRGLATVIRPFSFREYLRHRGEEPIQEPRRYTAPQRSLVEKRFHEFLLEGGFPEAQGFAPTLRLELLQSYVNTVLFRDIAERYKISQLAALRWLVRQCLRNPAGAFSVHRLHGDLRSQGLGVAKDALHAMFDHLLDAFLLSAVPLATESERQRNSNPRKLYPVDPGLIKAFDASGRANLGHALETVVANELERHHAEIAYVRTPEGFEVDFLARFPSGTEELIQVSADLSEPKTRDRELRALAAASKHYPRATQRILVLDRLMTSPLKVPHVNIQPAYEWMLSKETWAES